MTNYFEYLISEKFGRAYRSRKNIMKGSRKSKVLMILMSHPDVLK